MPTRSGCRVFCFSITTNCKKELTGNYEYDLNFRSPPSRASRSDSRIPVPTPYISPLSRVCYSVAGIKHITTLDLLLEKWRPETFAQPRCRNVAEALINHGVATNEISYLLTNYAYYHPKLPVVRSRAMLKGQRVLAKALIQTLEKDEATKILWAYTIWILNGSQSLGDINVDVVD